MKGDKYDHQKAEAKWSRANLASRRKATRSRSRGAVGRGKRFEYQHEKVEKFWQERWEKEGLYTPDIKNPKNKFYNLWMYPYPSGEGLHAGHAFASTGSDIYGRFMRMRGWDVFQPIGYDSFGLHSENYAIKINEHPAKMLKRTTKHYEAQLKSMGHGYDWARTVTVSDVDYYRWTQWLVLQLFKAGLAYRKVSRVNWCPSCKTVLADEQVIVGECERCGMAVTQKNLKQWFFRITDYGDRLLANLEKIDWSERVVTAQRNWIGKKDWIDISYPVKGLDQKIVVSTTRPDTNFGATFIVMAPEHPFLSKKNIPADRWEEVGAYIEKAKAKSELERIAEGRKKSGVFTGLYAINQLNSYQMPIWVADFVLTSVGTGAVVGVPGHDRRDFEFAKQYDLEIIRVVVGSDGETGKITDISQVQEDTGKMVNSEFLNGIDIHQATKKMMDYLEEKGWGRRTTRYHLRDWLISRQRYWGPPIPYIFCQACAKRGDGWFKSENAKQWMADLHIGSDFKKKIIGNWKLGIGNSAEWSAGGWWPVPEEDLPVLLPQISDFKPSGKGDGPLAKYPKFYKVKCPYCGNDARRETDVSDTFVDSAWYFLAYPLQGTEVWDKGPAKTSGKDLLVNPIIKKWHPVDLYFGGAEHSVLHLMYARFINMVLYDLKYLGSEEPFPKFFAHGLMIKGGAKMSKSRGNVVNPDEYIEKYGADTLRLYLMFMGPMDASPDFRDEGIEGMGRFVKRVWRLFQMTNDKCQMSNEEESILLCTMHQTIKKVTEDIEKFHYNTAISALMIYVNTLESLRLKAKSGELGENSLSEIRKPITDPLRRSFSEASNRQPKTDVWNESLFTLVLLLAPFAPHMAEEIYQRKFAGSTNDQLPITNKMKKSQNEKINGKCPPGADPPLAEKMSCKAGSRSAGENGKFQSVHLEAWPIWEEKYLKEDKVTIVVQVNGKVRGQLSVTSDQSSDREEIIKMAKEDNKVAKWLEGKKIKKEVFVEGKLVNFVTL